MRALSAPGRGPTRTQPSRFVPCVVMSNPQSLIPNPCYACLYQPRNDHAAANTSNALVAIAQEFSPRYERHRENLVSIDVSGLERLFGTPRTIGEALRSEGSARGMRVHVAVAARRMAALVLAQARPGLTIVEPGEEAAVLSSIPIEILQ